MENLEIPKPETPEREKLFSRIEILKRKFPDIGVACLGMKPMARKIEVCNMADPPAMQFWPKNIGEMKELIAGVKETASNISLHLPNPNFDGQTGQIDQKEEIIEILKAENSKKFDVVTIHLGWKEADLVIDERGGWRKTELAEKAASELADIFTAGIEGGKTMAIENIAAKEQPEKVLGTRPEHLMAAREKIAQIVATKTGVSVDKILLKIGFTFDLGHVVKNTALLVESPIKVWLEKLGDNIRLIHIHDVLPEEALPDEDLAEGDKNRYKRDHKPLGRGIIDWKSFFDLKKKYCSEIPMILELNNDGAGDKTVRSVDYLDKLDQ